MVGLTNRLLRRAQRCARGQAAAQADLDRAFKDRYGISYSDFDGETTDYIIDALDYGLGEDLTLSECDEIMTKAGYPPKKQQGLS